MSKPYRFMSLGGKGFKVVVFAKNERRSRNKIKQEAMSVIAYRALNWLACRA
mgnify:FL=1